MKTRISINKVEHLKNRSTVGLNIVGTGNEFSNLFNKVNSICKKHNAQDGLYDKSTDINREIGGSITFHNHSCNPKEAVEELINLQK
jgi:hypothetical protein